MNEERLPRDAKTGNYFSINPLLHELPSYQTLVRGPSTIRRKSILSYPSRTSLRRGESVGDENEQVDRPLRELPISIQEKKNIRAKQDIQISSFATQNIILKKLKWRRLAQGAKENVDRLDPWRKDIHDIEGKFGTGIQSYFSFLSFLVLLNFVIFILMFTFITLPMIIADHGFLNTTSPHDTSSAIAEECKVYEEFNPKLVLFYSYMTNLLSGTGFLEQTYLFYGFYRIEDMRSWNFHYNLPLAYFITTFAYILLSLFWIVKRAVEGFKQSFIRSEDRFQSFCNKIFAGWDFCIRDERAAELKHRSLQYELKTDLDEERIKQKIADRTQKEKVKIYLLRALLNLLVVLILIVCFYIIYQTTVYSQQYNNKKTNSGSFTIDLTVEYLPSIVITAANFITPLLFERIIRFEDYSPAFEIKFMLIRSVFVRLANIIVLLVSLWLQITTCGDGECKTCGYNHKLYPCWETRIGQEMYKLMIFDLIIIASVTLFVEFPRKLLVTFCPFPPFTWWGQQQFSVPQNVLAIVYGQTICWIGTFYSPLLPGIATIKYFTIFYIKKISLMTNCQPSTRPFRASSSNFFFLAVLLIGLPLACVPIIFSIALINSSKSCGPFIHFNTTWEIIPHTINSFPDSLRRLLYGLASEIFAVPFFIFVCLILFYLVALAAAHKRVVMQLRDQLAMQGRDKQYLIRKLTRESFIAKKRLAMSKLRN
ncbi:transmembrane channel-like protein 7 isoform X1 [Leucoraja erinacea]|uniref:transmembrane channel-like protein 7 isoform X1 n=1 Tax=Leucoraja erinaceus TaxID=7782 RepID=UPI0024560A7F|nr:transmembrane channel-like protein 7 isoform X1 [Leucoraja erinacea]